MFRSLWWLSILGLVATACATATPGAKPDDMSAAQHDREAQAHAEIAEQHAAQYQPNAAATREGCRARLGEAAQGAAATGEVCWTSVANPTETHLREAEEHRRQAAEHRAASAALRDAEERTCIGIAPADRDTSPFEHTDDIASVEPLVERTGGSKSPSQRTAGAVVVFRALPAMTAEWLQRMVDCHLARNAALGYSVPEMPNCPLVPRGATARVRSVRNGFAVEVRSDDSATAREILLRAQRLRAEPVSSGSPDSARR
jgi:hypothetical protein